VTLSQLKIILQAAREVASESEFYVIGSAAVLNVFNSPQHPFLMRSNEADLISMSGDADIADKLSVMMGELSPFHANHDVYADGVTFDAPVFAPEGWRDRAVRVYFEDIGVAARFMELHDLALSKLGAGRPKDLEFCRALAGTGYLDIEVLAERLALVKCTTAERELFEQRIRNINSSSAS